jgi:hypothetical protein
MGKTRCKRCNGTGTFISSTITGFCYGCGGSGTIDQAARHNELARTAELHSQRQLSIDELVAAGVPARFAAALLKAMKADTASEPWISRSDAGMALAAAALLSIDPPKCAADHPDPLAAEVEA